MKPVATRLLSVAAFSMTSSPRRTTSTLLGFFPMSCA